MIIAIIDNDKKELTEISLLISKELDKYSINHIIDGYNDPLSLNLNKYYNVLFLEIDLIKDSNQLVKKYHSIHKNTTIIFISNQFDHVLESFDIHPFRFVKKDNLLINIGLLIFSLIYKSDMNNFITIKTKFGLFDLPLDKVVYIRSNKHYCYLITSTNEYKLREKLNNINKLLSNDFCRIHRSIIINWQYVEAYNDKMIKIGNEYFSISKTYISKSKISYKAFLEKIT